MRLGDLDEALRMIENSRTDNPFVGNVTTRVWEMAHDSAISCVKACPTIDAVTVVRCRHCQNHHWEQEPCHGKTVHYCKKLNAEVAVDFFCAAGKRKDGDGNG